MMKRPFPPPKVPLPRPPPQLKKPAKPKPPPEAQKGEVSGVGKIFADFLRRCKRRLVPVLAATFLACAVSLIFLAGLGYGGLTALGLDPQRLILSGGWQEIAADPQQILANLPLLGLAAAMTLTVVLLWSWIYTTMLAAAVDEHHGIIEALCTGWKYFFSMCWIGTLLTGIFIAWIFIVSLMIAAGTVAAGTLIPSLHLPDINAGLAAASLFPAAIIAYLFFIIFILYVPFTMMFGPIAMIDEDHSGMDALLVSRLYMRGHWWDTFFKIILMWIILTALTLPLHFLHLFIDLSSLYQQAAVQTAGLFTAPLLLLYMVTVYHDLKQAAGKVDPSSACRCLWTPMALAGILLPLLGVIAAAVIGGPKGINQLLHGGKISPMSAPPAVQTVSSVDGFIIWRDPVGDTSSPLLDIRQVAAEGKHGALVLTAELARPLAEYFAVQKDDFDPLISFYFDTDLNPATGGAISGAEKHEGYDLHLEILLAAGRPYASLYRLDGQQKQSLEPLAEDALNVLSSGLMIRLPYERLGAAGGSVRVCFREAAQTEGDGLSSEQIVPLK